MTELHATVTSRLRAAGCVFAEEEAELLIEAALGSAARRGITGNRSPGATSQDPVWTPTDRRQHLERLVARRVGGEPLEHVLGWVDFAGRRWAVAPGVFVPRQRSELLVAQALAAVRGRAATSESGRSTSATVVVDLCCGNGALGGAVTAALRDSARPPRGSAADRRDSRDGADGVDVVLHAADLDPAATACAAANLAPLGGVVHTGDLFRALPRSLCGRVDVLLCHAPYVPSAAIALLPPEAREYEPLSALDGGPDGLDVLRRVIAEAPAWLAPGGALLFELGDEGQVAAAKALLARADLTAAVHEDDATGATVVVATRSAG